MPVKYSQEEFMRSQTAPQQPVVKADLNGKVAIVIGANTGLGFETAKHLALMNPAKLIMGCRDQARGQAALEKLTKETKFARVELWLIDLSDFSSVKAFADRVDKELDRLDILIENAGMATSAYCVTRDGWESCLQTNNLGPELLAIRLVPKMEHTAKTFSVVPRLVVVSSGAHRLVHDDDVLKLLQTDNIHKKLSDKDYCTSADVHNRYGRCKLLNVFFVRALTTHLSKSILVNAIDPGHCFSELRRNLTDEEAEKLNIKKMDEIAFTSEEGSRHIVYGATKDLGNREEEAKLRGQYIWACNLAEVSDSVSSDVGKEMQARVWNEMLEIIGHVDAKVPQIVKDYIV